MVDIPTRTAAETLTIAAVALGKIDLRGERAMTSLSLAEIDAMAVALTILGLIPIPPGTKPEEFGNLLGERLL